MRDGNKESAKELMSTFRLIVGASISVFLLFANFRVRGLLNPRNPLFLDLGLALALVSIALCGWLFFLVVAKLHGEEEDIAYQLPVLGIGGSAILAFAASVTLTLLA